MIIGRFGPPVLACLRSWGRQGWDVGFICIEEQGTTFTASRYLKEWMYLEPRLLFTQSGLDEIAFFLKAFQASGLACISENTACWLKKNNHVFDGVDLWFPPAETTERALSKKEQIETAKKIGLSVLPTYYLNNRKDLDYLPASDFPLCIRPSQPGSVEPTFKVKIVPSVDQADLFFDHLRRIQDTLIAQPFMNLPNLVVHGARSISGEALWVQGFRVDRKFEGLTLTIQPVDLSRDLTNKCIALVDALELSGNYHFEFLYDPATEKTYFLEINNRLGGTTAKVFSLGYDEPAYALQSYGVRLATTGGLRRRKASAKLALLKYIHYTLANRITPLDYPPEPKWKRIITALWGFCAYRDDVFSLRDFRGTWAFYRASLSSKLR